MSFDSATAYPRSILQPISLPAVDQRKDERSPAIEPHDKWSATIHTFLGTANRTVPSCWPPNRFTDDPVNIPDHASHNKPYVADSANPHPIGSEKSVFRIYNDAAPPASDDTIVPLPRLVAKRYLPHKLQSKPGLTLLMLPGIGLVKEAFEPMIDSLLVKDKYGDCGIAEIWAIDMPLSGATAQANPRGYLYGNEKDVARDLLLFLTAYLPVSKTDYLPSTLALRRPDGRIRPNLHVVGHSLGGQAAMLIAAHAPRIFSSLTVLDPAIIPSGKIQKAFTALPKDVLCMGIKYEHESKDALAAELRKNKRTRGWDERVLKIFLEHGTVVSKSDSKVRLASNPRLEWALYYDQETPSNCYDRLQDIRTPFNAIMPARPFAVSPKMFLADVGKLPQETRVTFLPDTTHQMPFEKVDECTELVSKWLSDRKYKTTQQGAKL